MSPDLDTSSRRSLRLERYNYAQAGAYFVTIVTQGRVSLFGRIENGVMRYSDAGEMIWAWWQRLPAKFSTVDTDAFVVIPNHVHGIVVITTPVGATPRGRPHDVIGEGYPHGGEAGHPHGGAPTLGDMVGWFEDKENPEVADA